MKRASVLAAAILLCSPSLAEACSCKNLGDAATELAAADAVFEGKVTWIEATAGSDAIERIGAMLGFEPSHDSGQDVHLEVNRSWKGVTTASRTVATTRSNCRFNFVVGDTFIIYAYTYEKRLWTSRCSRTRSIAGANDDLTFLQSQPAIALSPAPASRMPLIVAAAVLALAAAVAAVRITASRRASP